MDFFRSNAVLGIAAVGMSFVILSGGIDLSIGALIGCGSITIAHLITKEQYPPVVAMLLVAAGGTFRPAMGCLIYLFDLPPFLVTLGGHSFYRGVGLLISDEAISLSKNPTYKSLSDFSLQANFHWMLPEVAWKALPIVPITLPILMFFAALAIAMYVSLKTSFGRNVYAIGGSETSALLMGLPVGLTKITNYALCGFCGTIAAIAHTIDAAFRRSHRPQRIGTRCHCRGRCRRHAVNRRRRTGGSERSWEC